MTWFEKAQEGGREQSLREEDDGDRDEKKEEERSRTSGEAERERDQGHQPKSGEVSGAKNGVKGKCTRVPGRVEGGDFESCGVDDRAESQRGQWSMWSVQKSGGEQRKEGGNDGCTFGDEIRPIGAAKRTPAE